MIGNLDREIRSGRWLENSQGRGEKVGVDGLQQSTCIIVQQLVAISFQNSQPVSSKGLTVVWHPNKLINTSTGIETWRTCLQRLKERNCMPLDEHRRSIVRCRIIVHYRRVDRMKYLAKSTPFWVSWIATVDFTCVNAEGCKGGNFHDFCANADVKAV